MFTITFIEIAKERVFHWRDIFHPHINKLSNFFSFMLDDKLIEILLQSPLYDSDWLRRNNDLLV